MKPIKNKFKKLIALKKSNNDGSNTNFDQRKIKKILVQRAPSNNNNNTNNIIPSQLFYNYSNNNNNNKFAPKQFIESSRASATVKPNQFQRPQSNHHQQEYHPKCVASSTKQTIETNLKHKPQIKQVTRGAVNNFVNCGEFVTYYI
jgi:hypothetical protein